MPLSPNKEELAYQELEYELISNDRVREEWRLNGALHSVNDEPAVIINDGDELMWYTHGLRNRDGGPAWVQGERGVFMWYNAGQLHRKDGPALVSVHSQQWYEHGLMHNATGPARLENRAGGTYIQWWLNGTEYDSIDDWAQAGNVDGQLLVMTKLKYLGDIAK